ncbi:hypothetical protein [Salinimonas chungwhensis]|uniref:hypothetical protein n=1 Tax=Salinimonas chungwhensis TaxID=265425 RepID=UPI00036269E8|nr:hypothetical protein [Salinimonas chungwhensis]
MNVQLEYEFETEQHAYRFLNTAVHMDADGLKVRLGQSDHHVRVTYQYTEGAFDSTASDLDDLAHQLGGEELR